jgi:hypothetical protein
MTRRAPLARLKDGHMENVAAVFGDLVTARRAAEATCSALPSARVWLFAPQQSLEELERRLPVDDGERQGMGAAVGGVVGGAFGFTLATLLMPPAGVISVLALVGGALGGVAAGDKFEESLTHGIAHDDLLAYERELRRGRAVVVAAVDDDASRKSAEHVLRDAGGAPVAEAPDAAAAPRSTARRGSTSRSRPRRRPGAASR